MPSRISVWLRLSKTAERLWEDYEAFARRDLSAYEIVYLAVDRHPRC